MCPDQGGEIQVETEEVEKRSRRRASDTGVLGELPARAWRDSMKLLTFATHAAKTTLSHGSVADCC